MFLKNVNGDIVYEARGYIVSNILSEAMEAGACLKKINLRNVKIRNIKLKETNFTGSCFWGSDIQNVDFSYSDLSDVDFRNVRFTDCNFTGCNFTNANFLGASFKECNFHEADLSDGKFSNQSILYQNIDEALSLDGATYSHFGEVQYDLSCFLSGHANFIECPKFLCNQFVKSADSHYAKNSSHNP